MIQNRLPSSRLVSQTHTTLVPLWGESHHYSIKCYTKKTVYTLPTTQNYISIMHAHTQVGRFTWRDHKMLHNLVCIAVCTNLDQFSQLCTKMRGVNANSPPSPALYFDHTANAISVIIVNMSTVTIWCSTSHQR